MIQDMVQMMERITNQQRNTGSNQHPQTEVTMTVEQYQDNLPHGEGQE
jgi:hypothetical protein